MKSEEGKLCCWIVDIIFNWKIELESNDKWIGVRIINNNKNIVFFIKKDQKCRFYIFDSLKLPKIKISMSYRIRFHIIIQFILWLIDKNSRKIIDKIKWFYFIKIIPSSTLILQSKINFVKWIGILFIRSVKVLFISLQNILNRKKQISIFKKILKITLSYYSSFYSTLSS